jgi:hypothetical protein
MGDLTKNFSSWEFECHCGHLHTAEEKVRPDFVEVLQLLRDDFNLPINIISGFRCPLHKLTLGRTGSSHALGIASDIVVAGIRPVRVGIRIYETLFPEKIGGLGVNWENGTVHIDAREPTLAAVWKYRHGRPETIRACPRQALSRLTILENKVYG